MTSQRRRGRFGSDHLVGSGLFATWYFEWWPTPEVVPTGVGPRLYGPDEESLDGKPINILLFHR